MKVGLDRGQAKVALFRLYRPGPTTAHTDEELQQFDPTGGRTHDEEGRIARPGALSCGGIAKNGDLPDDLPELPIAPEDDPDAIMSAELRRVLAQQGVENLYGPIYSGQYRS
jgi:hypothetical protein